MPAGSSKLSTVHALVMLVIYLVPFLAIAVGVRSWMRRQVSLSDVQAEGDPKRQRARFLLGIWRREGRD
jgi:hypothetical protein